MRLLNAINKLKVVRLIFNIFVRALTTPAYLFGFVVPKKKNTWVLGNHLGEKDNCFYLFQHLTKKPTSIKAIWISKNNKKIHLQNKHAFYYLSPLGLYYQYIAGVSIHTSGLGDFAKFTGAKKYRVQLWHGIPIKKIMLDSVESIPFIEMRNPIGNLSRFLFGSYLNNTYSLVIASSHSVKKNLMSAFNQPQNKVAITGYPRHDVIFKDTDKHASGEGILYAPTWRTNNQEALKIITSCLETIAQSTLSNQNVTICIHPLNQRIKQSIKLNSKISIFEGDDINTELGNFDTLITDYSSIALDFLLFKRKILFYTPDLNLYSKDRGIYPEFLHLIRQNQFSLFSQKTTHNKAFEINKYFKYADSLACERIIQRILHDTNIHL